MIRRPPRSTQSRSSAASDVYKRQADVRHIQTELLLRLPLRAPSVLLARSQCAPGTSLRGPADVRAIQIERSLRLPAALHTVVTASLRSIAEGFARMRGSSPYRRDCLLEEHCGGSLPSWSLAARASPLPVRSWHASNGLLNRTFEAAPCEIANGVKWVGYVPG